MKQMIVLLSVLFFYNAQAQVSFENEITLIDPSYYSSDIRDLFSADLNNDGFKDLIVSSYNDNKVMLYENVNGDLQAKPPHILSADLNIPISIYVNDMDNDGYKDIVVASEYGYKVVWFRNLGNSTFSDEIVIGEAIGMPKSVVAEDIDNDGDNDIVAGIRNPGSVTVFLNNGDGTFSDAQTIYATSYDITKVVLFDTDNDGLLDIISGQSSGTIYYSKNLGNGNFSDKLFISGSAYNGTEIAFADANNDGFSDLITCSSYYDKVVCFLSDSGLSFPTRLIIDNTIVDPYHVKSKDMDGDGVADIVVTAWYSNSRIGWYKNNSDSTFSTLNTITTNIRYPRAFVIDDLNNDSVDEIIISSYGSDNTEFQKLSCFSKDTISNTYSEKLISFLLVGANTVKIADLNNDGLNDIVSAYEAVVWNKNKGNNTFTSYRLISNSIAFGFVQDIEIKDMDNDGWLDIVAVKGTELEFYRNNGDETFTLICSKTLAVQSQEIEVADINGDHKPDIVIISTISEGNVRLGVMYNLGDNTYGDFNPITFNYYNYEPYKICSGDIDNDGDIDLAISSRHYSGIQWLENDGKGVFSYHNVQSPLTTCAITLADVNNDSFLDIISGGIYVGNKNLYWIPNNKGSFGSAIQIEANTGINALAVVDINNDGNKDLICAYFNDEDIPNHDQIFYYLNDGKGFKNKVLVSNIAGGFSLNRNLAVADLNNDLKADIVTSYAYEDKVGYFLNSSTIFTNTEIENTQQSVYPNPTTDKIYWTDILSNQNISIYNSAGSAVYNKVDCKDNYLDLSFLKRGIYIVKFQYRDKVFTKKIVIN